MKVKKKAAKEAVALNFDEGKIRLDLIPPEFEVLLADAMAEGAKKYAPNNWRRGGGMLASRNLASCLRHINAWRAGEDYDKETKQHHLAHAACRLAFLLTHIARGELKDDRWKCEIPTDSPAA